MIGSRYDSTASQGSRSSVATCTSSREKRCRGTVFVRFIAKVAALFAVSIGLSLTAADAGPLTTQTWRPVEITLISNRTYKHPYLDMDVAATFTGPDGRRMTMPGFWDGGSIWRVRFAPPSPGTWRYTIVATDPRNAIHGISGTVVVSRYRGALPIYRRGFIKALPGKRFLTYYDGTPFYWLGDTHWSGFNSAESLSAPVSGGHSMFRTMVDRRVRQGFTVWKAETFANNDEAGNFPVNEGGRAWGAGGFFVDLNPRFWQNIDQRVRYVAGKGLVIAIAQGVGRSLRTSAGVADHRRLARYIIARYGAYPTVWLTAQEYDAFGTCGACWTQVAAYSYSLDPYKRANSVHNGPANNIANHDADWLGFVTLQQAHNVLNGYTYWKDQYDATPAKPVLEDEANYEDIIPYYGYGKVTEKWKTRQSAWQAQIGGAFGFTYGAQGIWWGCRDAVDPHPNCGSGKDGRAWFTALEFEVGEQMAAMKRFWTSLAWWELSPDPGRITWADAPSGTQAPFQKSDGNARDIIVAYLPRRTDGGAAYGGLAHELDVTKTYKANWFDPRRGSYKAISLAIRPSGLGDWAIPAPPSSEDWVLLIERR